MAGILNYVVQKTDTTIIHYQQGNTTIITSYDIIHDCRIGIVSITNNNSENHIKIP